MKKVFKGWVSKRAKAHEFFNVNCDFILETQAHWRFFSKKQHAVKLLANSEHKPPKRITVTVEVSDET